jgi:hypothetical protein
LSGRKETIPRLSVAARSGSKMPRASVTAWSWSRTFADRSSLFAPDRLTEGGNATDAERDERDVPPAG